MTVKLNKHTEPDGRIWFIVQYGEENKRQFFLKKEDAHAFIEGLKNNKGKTIEEELEKFEI